MFVGLAFVHGETETQAQVNVASTAGKTVVFAAGLDGCFTNAPDATLTPTPTTTVFPFAKQTVPASPPVVWWSGGLGCPKTWVVEFPVTKASLAPTATSVNFAYMIGGRDNNKWETPRVGAGILTSDELAPECKPLDGPCIKAKMSDRCPRMVFTATVAMKKTGETKFTVYRSTAFSMSYEPSSSACTLDTPGPGSENYTHLVKVTPQEVTASLYRVPPAGQTDTYRVLLSANLAKEPVSQVNGIWPSWVGGSATLSNPVVAQYPVGLYLKH